MRTRSRRDEDGNIVITMTVIMVASALIVVLTNASLQGLHLSRRAGDSANALQVSDAGVNDAISAVQTAAPAPCTINGVSENCIQRSGTLGTGTYTYTAWQSSGGSGMWHIDVTGVDATGVKRHVQADAATEPLFERPIYVAASGTFSSGVLLDSYSDGLHTCTGNGVLGTRDPADLSFGTSSNSNSNGVGTANCTYAGANPSFPVDGCATYYTNPPAPAFPPSTGTSGHCPPAPLTYDKQLTYSPSAPQRPSTQSNSCAVTYASIGSTCYNFGSTSATLTCDVNNPLIAGKVYSYPAVSLRDGCLITGITMVTDPVSGYTVPDKPVFIYTPSLDVGVQTGGSNQVVNQPPGALSGHTCNLSGAANLCYMQGWVRSLSIFMTGAVGSSQVNLNNNQMFFWGLIDGPNTATHFNNSGMNFWGGLITNTATSGSQFNWHYDDTLSAMTDGKYFPQNWREEPVTSP